MQPRGPIEQADPRSALSPGNYTLNSQIWKTKSKISLHIRAVWILGLPGHQTTSNILLILCGNQ